MRPLDLELRHGGAGGIAQAHAGAGQHRLWPALHLFPAGYGLIADQCGQPHRRRGRLSGYELTLRTADLPVGAYDQTITLPPATPTTRREPVHYRGRLPRPAATRGIGPVQRPLDVPVTVTGSHSQGGSGWSLRITLGRYPQKPGTH